MSNVKKKTKNHTHDIGMIEGIYINALTRIQYNCKCGNYYLQTGIGVKKKQITFTHVLF